MDKPSKQVFGFICLLAVIAGLYVYRATGLFFLADDFIHIPESSHSLLAQRNYLRPVGNLSLYIDFLLSGTNALGYHISNLMLHIINSLLVYVLSSLLLKKYSVSHHFKIFSLTTAVLFFIYPFHSEAVFWIIGRSGSLGCLFFLVAFICFLQKEKSIVWFIASVLSFELALLAYESSWIFPLMVFLLTIFQPKNKKQWWYVVIVWLLFAVHVAYRYKVTGELFSKYDTASLVHFNMETIALNFTRLFARTFLPPFVYERDLIIAFAIAVAILAVLVIQLLRKNKPTKLFMLLTVLWIVSYLPYLSLGIDTHGVEGERYLYLPSVLFCIWLVHLLGEVLKSKIFFIAITLLFSLSSFFLFQSRSYYVKAGSITKTTITQIENSSNKQTIFIENLPQYKRGAVVYRLGFEEGIKWLLPNFKQNIIIVSIDSSDVQPTKNCFPNFTVHQQVDTIIRPIKTMMVKDESFKTNYKLKDTVGLFFNPAKDVLFHFSDSGLVITRYQ